MKPVAAVKERACWDSAQSQLVDVPYVALVPSHELGHFLISDEYYGKKVVGRVALFDADREDVEALHSAGEFPLDKYVTFDEQGMATVIGGRAEVNVLTNRGSGSSISMPISRFTEFAPVAAAQFENLQ
jgi:hypothetical protein